MRTYYYALNKNEEYIFDNFPEDLKYLVKDYKESREPIIVKLNNEKIPARMACKRNEFGSIYILTTEKKYINRLKFFRELVELSVIGLKPLVNFQNDLVTKHSEENEEFIHNVTSLNTYSVQDLFALIPQKTLTENITKQSEKVKEIISEKPNVAVNTLLNLIKYSLATKVEFSVFERTLKPNATVTKTRYPIRSLILSVLQIFIDDFERKNIEVYLDSCEKVLEVDYDSLFVSLYYLFDNSIKYCCNRTDYKIHFFEKADCFEISIVMISIRIEEHEKDKINIRGYRSEAAKKLNAVGNGIGMFRIMKTLRLNNAILEIVPRCNKYQKTVNKISYEGNEFKIKFPGQQDWFVY